MTTLGKVQHGSRLYGLHNAMSDFDEKSIHLPPLTDCLLLRATQNQHTKDERDGLKVECESFALQTFLKLAANGEDCAFTTLHVSPHHILEDSPTFRYLRDNRARFYTKAMSGSVGFAKSQCAKYSLRAERMVAVERMIAALERAEAEAKGVVRLYQCWDDLPRGDHIEEVVSDNNRDAVDKRILEVAGKGLPATVAPAYAREILVRVRDSYGERVKAARSMDRQDFKSISHSFRVGYQLIQLYTMGDFSFPLAQSPFIRDVKEGRLNYVDDRLGKKLDELITQVEGLAEASSYPERVDQSWLDQIVLDAYERHDLGTIRAQS